MKKTARRTDRAIIIALVAIAVIILISAKTNNKPPETEPDTVLLESYNGKPMGVMPGSPSEDVTAEYFPNSTITSSGSFDFPGSLSAIDRFA